ncbi:MAG TPA: PadR family transcriptional regulator [Thermoanaerobaculia bacterium]|nr:PadR family transcriptional regulator [Thermoanaerobaculia bacterium]
MSAPTRIDPKTALLQALVSGDGYGLELIQRVKVRNAGKVVLHQGSIYPALRALEQDGLVESYESEPMAERGGRPRIYYRLTGEGRRAALEERPSLIGLFVLVPALG